MWFAGCLLGCMSPIQKREGGAGEDKAPDVVCWLLARLHGPDEKREGGAGEGAAPPLQCKQSLDSSFVLATQVFLGDHSGLLSIAACKTVFSQGSLWQACCLQLWWFRRG